MPVIYTITNQITGKVYVGSAVDYLSRKRVHRHHLSAGTHHAPYLQSSWKKYGEAAFVFEVVEEVAEKFWLLAREQAWINRLCAADREYGYNARPTAESNLGKAMSSEQKEKIRAIRLGSKHTEASIEKMRGRVQPEGQREKRSESLKKAYAEGRHPGGWASFKGVPKSEEWKAKRRGKSVSDLTRQRMAEAAKLRPSRGPLSEETKRKMAATVAAKKAWEPK